MGTCLKIEKFPDQETITPGQIYTLRTGVSTKMCELLMSGEEKYDNLALRGMWPEAIILCDEIISKISDPQSVDFDRYLLEIWENKKTDAYDTILENLLSN